MKRVIGIVGSYRKGGVVDTALSAVLASAAENGAETVKHYLLDKDIKFCTNCRECMQTPGPERGKCVLDDDMEALLQNIETADSLVIGSPVNFNNVTAIMRTFMERCVGHVYWPWGIEKPLARTPGLTCPPVSNPGNLHFLRPGLRCVRQSCRLKTNKPGCL